MEFNSLEVPYGRNKGEVRIDSGDALPADDTFYFSVERADPRHALFVSEAGNTTALLYFKTALEASGQDAFTIDSAMADQVANVNPAKYAFVVLADVGALPASFENELTQLCARRRERPGCPGPHFGGPQQSAGNRRAHRGDALCRTGRRAFRDRPPGWIPRTPPSRRTTAGTM